MNIIVQGPQGSGKGTQVEKLVQKYNLKHFDAGSLLRKEASEEIKKIMDKGELVPQYYVKQLVEKFIAENPNSGFVFDGYPRTIDQYEELKTILQNKIDYVVNIEISIDESVRRLSLRGREDDKPEAIKRRLQIYHTQTHPVFEKAVAEGIGFEVNGEQSIEQVFADICRKLI